MSYSNILIHIIPFALFSISSFLNYRKIFIMFSIIVYFFYVIFMDILPMYLIGLTLVFYCITKLFYNKKNIAVNVFLIFISVIFYFCLQNHLFPDVNNVLLIKDILLGKEGIPWNLYINYDKPLIAFITLFITHKQQNYKIFDYKKVIATILIGPIVIMTLSLSMKFIKYDFKVDPVLLWAWGLNNLFIVCFTEEIFFRQFLYNMLIRINTFNKYNNCIALFLSSLFFGISHYFGGIVYVFLSFCAGIMYCLLYIYSKKIQINILGHFMLNLIHFIFFSYPMCKQ